MAMVMKINNKIRVQNNIRGGGGNLKDKGSN